MSGEMAIGWSGVVLFVASVLICVYAAGRSDGRNAERRRGLIAMKDRLKKEHDTFLRHGNNSYRLDRNLDKYRVVPRNDRRL